jgi:hypothetical protein
MRNDGVTIEKRGKIKKPSFELMEKIADALRVSMDDFRKSGDYK